MAKTARNNNEMIGKIVVDGNGNYWRITALEPAPEYAPSYKVTGPDGKKRVVTIPEE